MLIELTEVRHPSTNVHSIGFEGDRRGDLHVQFQDKDGRLTVRGYYRDVPRALFNALESDRAPGRIVNHNLKNRFEWVVSETTETQPPPDATLPDNLFIPFDVVNTVEAIQACIESQRVQIERKGLFE